MSIRIMLAASFLFLAAGLQADDQVVRGVCKADKEKFCKDVQPGEGRIMQCLSENKAQLTPDCAKKIEGFHDGFQKACGADLQKFCARTEKGKGRRIKCLNDNAASLSPACKTKLDEFKAQHQGKAEERKQFKEACKADVKTHCKNIPHGQGRVVACLREKQASLSAGCQAELAKVPAPQQ
jgi:Golgi apparatus protein 1